MRTTREGWVVADVSEKMIAKANRIRAVRDAELGNTHARRPGDKIWVGDLGEIAFDQWLWTVAPGSEWIIEEVKGRPDFIVHGFRVDVKTEHLNKGHRFQLDYGCSAHRHHVEEPVADYFFFAAYDPVQREMLLVGGVSLERFSEVATYYEAGDVVIPGHWTLAKDHQGLYRCGEGFLKRPLAWLAGLVS